MRNIQLNRAWIRIGVFLCLTVAVSVLIYLVVEMFIPHMEEWKEYGYLGVFIATFLTNATVIIPVLGLPSIALAGAVAASTDLYSVAAVCAAGAALGEGVGYLFGLAGRKMSEKEQSWLSLHRLYQKIENWLQRHWWLLRPYQAAKNWIQRHWWATIFIFALPLLPFDPVGIAAGIARYPILKFLVFCFFGKYIGFLIYVALGIEVLEHFLH